MRENEMSPDSIREIAVGFQRSRILLTAYELGVFSAAGDRQVTSAEVARTLHTNPRATDRLMNAVVALGLMVKEGNTFRNAPAALRFLLPSSPDYLTGLMHTVHLWDTWSTLTEAVQAGRSVSSRREPEADRAAWTTAFIAAMNDRARKQAPITAGLLGLKEGMRILDVGGGSGAFAVAFARAARGVRVTVFDLPNVLPLTGGYVSAAGCLDRIDFASGDYTKDELPRGYDLVFLSAIVHSNSAEENRKLVRKCAAALNEGGSVVVQDFIMDESRTTPPGGAFFALNMLVGTAAGDTYTESEVRSWMEEAGLSGVTRVDTPFGSAQLRGKKSA